VVYSVFNKRRRQMHNPYAKSLSSKLFQKKAIRAKKGRGSYTRRDKNAK